MLIQVKAIEIILQITRESHENHMFLSHHNNDLDYINHVIFKLKAGLRLYNALFTTRLQALL